MYYILVKYGDVDAVWIPNSLMLLIVNSQLTAVLDSVFCLRRITCLREARKGYFMLLNDKRNVRTWTIHLSMDYRNLTKICLLIQEKLFACKHMIQWSGITWILMLSGCAQIGGDDNIVLSEEMIEICKHYPDVNYDEYVSWNQVKGFP